MTLLQSLCRGKNLQATVDKSVEPYTDDEKVCVSIRYDISIHISFTMSKSMWSTSILSLCDIHVPTELINATSARRNRVN